MRTITIDAGRQSTKQEGASTLYRLWGKPERIELSSPLITGRIINTWRIVCCMTRKLLALIAASTILVAVAPIRADPGAEEAVKRELLTSLVTTVFDSASGEAWSCADPLIPPTPALDCLQAREEMLILAHWNDGEPGDVVGWHYVEVWGDSIVRGCGWYTAQDGDISCRLDFGDAYQRKVISFGWSHCDWSCNNGTYLTTGNLHNYLGPFDHQDGKWSGSYVAIKNGSYAVPSDRRCYDKKQPDPFHSYADGGLQEQSSEGAPCQIRWSQVMGTWGIRVRYEPHPNDEEIKGEYRFYRR